MGNVVLPSTLVNGTLADATQVMADLNAIVAQINGNIDDTNIKATANIAGSKLLDGSLGKVKLATDALNAFLKLAAAADKKLAFGYQALTFPGGSPNAGLATVTHGLGATPVMIQVTAGTAPGGLPVAASFETFGSTTFAIRARTADGSSPASGSIDCFWCAIA